MMTMPHLMNCSHSELGWCLECVGKLADELTAWKELAYHAAECLHNPADCFPELIGTGEKGLWEITQQVGSSLVRGPQPDAK